MPTSVQWCRHCRVLPGAVGLVDGGDGDALDGPAVHVADAARKALSSEPDGAGLGAGSSATVSVKAVSASTGASLTAVTVIVAVSVAVLKAVVPPFGAVSTLVPAVPLVWSQARKVTVPLVAVLPVGDEPQPVGVAQQAARPSPRRCRPRASCSR